MTGPPLALLAYPMAGRALFCLVVGGLLTALFSAYTLTGQVGVERLGEKFPDARHRLALWAPRWDVVRVTLMLWSILTQVGLIFFTWTALLQHPWHLSWAALGVTLLVVVLLGVFFHILPRAISRSYADRLSVASLPAVALLTRLSYPLAWPVTRLTELLDRLFRAGADEEDSPSAEDEILSAVSRASGEDLEAEERQIIERAVDLAETVAREIMTPRVDAEGLEDTETVRSAVDIVKDSSHSRFPLYHDTMDDIRGVVHVKDLLRHLGNRHDEQPVACAAKPAPFVPESMPVNDLLTLLISEKSQTAIVVDEYGGTAGLVTMEDVFEELVGEILDEYDAEEQTVHRLSDGSAVLDARTPVDEVNTLLDIHMPESDEYDSAGGYVFHELGRIPRAGETVDGPDFQVTVQTANERQLQTLRVLKR